MEITIKTNELTSSIKLSDESSAAEVLKGFCALMNAQSYLVCTIKKALENVLEDYNEDIKLCQKV